MQRRNFIKTTSLAGLTLTTLGAASCKMGVPSNAESPEPWSEEITKFALDEFTIDQLQQKMQSGEYTSRAICELYLKRIDAVDKSGPKLNAVLELNHDALNTADVRDKERKDGKVRGPLHGIPVLIKDNIDTGDNMMTTAGSLALAGHFAAQDAFIIKQLRAAGAIILGKTNLSEWANFRSDRSTSAWSSRGGQTRMPYILDRNPSGSSSGTGSAVAANLCAIGIGTETDGSVVSPSSVNGLVGIKPTVGLLSRAGIIPISKTQDTGGPMARTVKDAAILLTVLAGADDNDGITLINRDKPRLDYTNGLQADGLKGKRLGVEKSFLKGNAAVVKLLNQALDVLKSQGATIVEVDLLKSWKDIGNVEFQVLLYEFKDGLNQYLSHAKAGVKSLNDIIAFNNKNEAKAMPYFKQEIMEQAEAKGGLDSKEYLDALKKSTGVSRTAIDEVLKQNQLDAIIGTTNGMACCIDLINGDYDTGFSFSTPAAMAGYPHITVPMGLVLGLPMGLSFVGTAYTETQLIKLAYAYEQASKKREKPKFLKNLIP